MKPAKGVRVLASVVPETLSEVRLGAQLRGLTVGAFVAAAATEMAERVLRQHRRIRQRLKNV